MNRIKSFFIKFFHRKRLIRWGVVLGIFLLLFIFRAPILRGLGNWLINEDDLEKADAIVLLGGNPYERAPEAAKILNKNYAGRVFCTGSNVSPQLKALGLNITEAENSQRYLVRLGVPDSLITVVNKATSTLEEAKVMLVIAKKQKLKKLIIVTAKFHTARVRKYFNRIFEDSGINLIVRGAQPLNYKIDLWWHSEEGLLFVNNEYVKSFYYWWNY